eukprot:938341_1
MFKSILLITIVFVPHLILCNEIQPKRIIETYKNQHSYQNEYPSSDDFDICPGLYQGTPIEDYAPIPDIYEYNKALSHLNIKSVILDIQNLLHNSQDCWPADEFPSGVSYGPLFIRLAWHCSGTYRATDNRGGCAGGRQRFSPESSWEDNTNLDKARALLAPIKNKYGIALSWGDLIILSGYASIMDMGGPINHICVGRVDEQNGINSEALGPSALQETQYPCPIPGECPPPFGSNLIELIYVNPEGFMGKPIPEISAKQIRKIFGRMDMNNRETVALIGGGHAFGKSHGACVAGAGLSPHKDPYNPWPGNCGNGKGENIYTSGIEGEWTNNPLKWDNEYFKLLIQDEYELITGIGGKYQWKNKRNGLMMMTSDLALIYDEQYDEIVDEFANDINALDKEFANAWSKLVRRGGQWSEKWKCIDVNDWYNSNYGYKPHFGYKWDV